MTKRKAVPKGVRFEIFKRDGFTCQYCGRRPPDVVLELDHIHPVSKGGDNDPMNLVTSCADCNRGKSDKILKERAPRPDADFAWLEMQQELAELRRYNESKALRDDAIEQTVMTMQEHWGATFGIDWVPVDNIMTRWIKQFGPAEIEIAIDKAVPRQQKGISQNGLIKYVAKILWNRLRGEG